jgi:TldD protein
MSPSRRRFLQSLAAGRVASSVPRWAGAATFDPHASRRRRCAIRNIANGRRGAGRAKRLGCSYADIRFTRNRAQSIGVRNGLILRGGGGFGGGDATETYGFGVRVIHSGGWGFASSPLVTPERIKRVAAVAVDVARASAIAKKRDVPACAGAGVRPVLAGGDREGPWSVPLEEKVEHLRAVTSTMQKNASVLFAVASMSFEHEWKYLANERRFVHRAGVHFADCEHRRDRAHRQPGEDAQLRAARRRRLRVPAQVDLPATPSASPPSGRALDGQAGRAAASRISS